MPGTTSRSLWFGLRRRLVLAFALVIGAFVSGVIYTNTHVQNELIEIRLRQRASELCDIVREVTSSYLVDFRVDELTMIYADLLRQPDVAYAWAVDADSLLVANGDETDERLLARVDDELTEDARNRDTDLQRRDRDMLHIAIPIKLGDDHFGVARFGLRLDAFKQDVATVWRTNLVVGGVFIIVGVIAGVLVARRLTKPLNALIDLTQAAAQGDLEQSVELSTNDELEQLAHSFNGMLGALRTSMSEATRLAYEDPLTGLPNRAAFNEKLRQTVADAAGTQSLGALMFLDLDRFKHVNDALGHDVGDALLCAFAERLQTAVRSSDSVARYGGAGCSIARLGGDEFTILLNGLHNEGDAAAVANRIVRSLEDPLAAAGHQLRASTSIGIALFPTHAVETDELLRFADAAMYEAKRCGKDGFRFFDQRLAEQALERVTFEQELRSALELDQLVLVYQPLYSVGARAPVGAEALVRWQHPEAGMLTPDRFLPIVEEMGLLPQLGQVVLRKSLSAAVRWPRGTREPLRLAVNLTVNELEDTDFARRILADLRQFDFPASDLELEVTESTAMVESDLVMRQFDQLRAAGVGFAVDDFGTGFSNLARLKRLDFQTLKVDRSLLRGVGVDRDANALFSSIMSMARSMHLKVVAEGIETEAQFLGLVDQHCDFAQGFMLSRPMSSEAFEAMIGAGVSTKPTLVAAT